MDLLAPWKTCYEVNNYAFVTKPETVAYLTCVQCRTPLQSTKRYSSVLEATEWPCGHQMSGYLCTACDQDYLLRVTQRQQRCLFPSCEALVKVKLEEVEDRLQRRPDILAR